jgi:glucose-6-phosphate-specific signal transduction histidine kinase
LLRLLMDGHVLMLSGILCVIAWWMHPVAILYGNVLALVTGLFMLGYCLMIWPFLRSVMTLLITLAVITVSVYGMF